MCVCVCQCVCFLGSCLILRLDCYSCRGDLDAETRRLSAILKSHCTSLPAVCETNTHCDVTLLYMCAQTPSCIHSSIQTPLQSPTVLRESSRDAKNRTFNLCFACLCVHIIYQHLCIMSAHLSNGSTSISSKGISTQRQRQGEDTYDKEPMTRG